ncbi:MAG: xanthine dehydrogenase family protein subunit M [Candidatus Brocadiia bacterium]
MQPFDYVRPHSLAEATDLLSSHAEEAALLAGGTDLIVQMEKGARKPAVVIDLKHVAELAKDIDVHDGQLRVGALVSLSDAEKNENIRGLFPALAEAARVIGSVQIRNRATLVGNICNASPAADTAPPLLVYDARVNVFGPQGRRTVPIDEFFLGPGLTALEPGELVESVDLPSPNEPTSSAFCRLARRRGMDLASVSVACRVTASGELRLAFGAAGPTPILVKEEDAAFLRGASSDRLNARLKRLAESARPISDVRAGEDYRRAMLPVLSRRALEAARELLKETR